tara:strand:- start:161 stop:2209 length:2049 start_codon:yes stop_codon:yes gene_type:complete
MILPFLALPPLAYGYYHQIEPLTAGLWFLGGVSALWGYLSYFNRPGLMEKIYLMPVVWAQVPFIAYTLLQCFFIETPLLSLVGTPHLGQGVLSCMAFFFLTPPLVLLTKIKAYRIMIITVATLSCTLLCGLTIMGSMDSPFESMRYWVWCPVFFPDYIAFGLVSLAGLYWGWRSFFNNALSYHVLFICFLAVASYYSYNQSIFVAYLLAVFTFCVVRFGPFRMMPVQKRFALYLFLGLMTLTFFLSAYDIISPFLPKGLQNQGTLTSRLYLAKMTFMDFIYRPFDASFLADFLFGRGWGGFNNATLSNIFLVNDISLFSEGNWKPTWEFLDRDLLHSHNFLLETFLSSGVVGGLIFLYTKYVLISGLRQSHLFAGVFFLTAYLVVSTFWFELLHSFPYVLLATAFLFGRQIKTPSFWSRACRVVMAGGIILIPLSFVFVVFSNSFNNLKLQQGDDLLAKMTDFVASPLVPHELAMGGLRSVGIARRLTNELKASFEPPQDVKSKKSYIENTEKPTKVESRERLSISSEEALRSNVALAETLFNKGNNGASLNALILSLNILTEMSTHEKMASLFFKKQEALLLWGKIALQIHEYLRFRTDILSPYFNHLLETHQYQRLSGMLEKAIENNPHDPIAHWYEGLSYLKTKPNPQQGLESLKLAINLGVTRFLPIPKKEIQAILSH